MHLYEDSPIGCYKAYYSSSLFLLCITICELSAMNKESRLVAVRVVFFITFIKKNQRSLYKLFKTIIVNEYRLSNSIRTKCQTRVIQTLKLIL